MNITERLAFACPFCGARAAVVDDSDGNPGTQDMPMCEKFEQLEPPDFLAAVNKAKREALWYSENTLPDKSKREVT